MGIEGGGAGQLSDPSEQYPTVTVDVAVTVVEAVEVTVASA